MPRKPRTCHYCSHRWVCKHMKALEKILEGMYWNVNSSFYYVLITKPIFGIVAKRCNYFEWIKE